MKSILITFFLIIFSLVGMSLQAKANSSAFEFTLDQFFSAIKANNDAVVEDAANHLVTLFKKTSNEAELFELVSTMQNSFLEEAKQNPIFAQKLILAYTFVLKPKIDHLKNNAQYRTKAKLICAGAAGAIAVIGLGVGASYLYLIALGTGKSITVTAAIVGALTEVKFVVPAAILGTGSIASLVWAYLGKDRFLSDIDMDALEMAMILAC